MTTDVEVISIDSIRPYHRNPRDHGKTAQHVQDSIRQYGFRVPIILTDEHEIVAGHGRFKAVQRLRGQLDARVQELRNDGRDKLADNLAVINGGEVFGIYESELDSQDISEFRISDNRITELSSWNEDLLAKELERLDADEATPGFTEQEIADLVDSYEIEIEEPDEHEGRSRLDRAFDDEAVAVELICPHCLDEFEISEEMARMELRVMGEDWENDDPAELDGDTDTEEIEADD